MCRRFGGRRLRSGERRSRLEDRLAGLPDGRQNASFVTMPPRRRAALSSAALLVAGIAGTPTFAAGPPLNARLELAWTAPIGAARDPLDPYSWSGIRIDDLAAGPDGRVVAYAASGPDKLLLLDPLRSPAAISAGIDQPRPSWLRRQWRWPTAIDQRYVQAFAIDSEGLWIAGFANRDRDMSSRVTGKAYVARLGPAGGLRWENIYGDGAGPQIEQLAADGTGGIVAVGRSADSGQRTARLLRITKDGQIVATHNIGHGDGQTIVRTTDRSFLIAGPEVASPAPNGPAFLATWRLAPDNRLSGPLRVAGMPPGTARDLVVAAMSAADDGAYLLARWSNFPDNRAAVVFRLDRNGRAVWHAPLPATIRPRGDRAGSTDACDPALVTLPDGTALVACALAGRLDLYRLDARNGAVTSGSLPLPACQRAHAARIMMVRQRGGAIFVAGSRHSNNVAANCSWMGRLVID